MKLKGLLDYHFLGVQWFYKTTSDISETLVNECHNHISQIVCLLKLPFEALPVVLQSRLGSASEVRQPLASSG